MGLQITYTIGKKKTQMLNQIANNFNIDCTADILMFLDSYILELYLKDLLDCSNHKIGSNKPFLLLNNQIFEDFMYCTKAS